MDVIAQNHILQAVYYSDVDDLDSHLEPVSVPIEPRDHSDEAAQQQAGCRKHLTHTHTHLECTPSLLPQLRGSLRCSYSYRRLLSDHMSQPAVGGLGFVIVISVWHAFFIVLVISHSSPHSSDLKLHVVTLGS